MQPTSLVQIGSAQIDCYVMCKCVDVCVSVTLTVPLALGESYINGVYMCTVWYCKYVCHLDNALACVQGPPWDHAPVLGHSDMACKAGSVYIIHKYHLKQL